MRIGLAILLAASLLLGACNETRFDATNKDTSRRSILDMQVSMGKSDAAKLEKALNDWSVVILERHKDELLSHFGLEFGVCMLTAIFGGDCDTSGQGSNQREEFLFERTATPLHGKTAKEIIAFIEAEQGNHAKEMALRREREEAERQRLAEAERVRQAEYAERQRKTEEQQRKAEELKRLRAQADKVGKQIAASQGELAKLESELARPATARGEGAVGAVVVGNARVGQIGSNANEREVLFDVKNGTGRRIVEIHLALTVTSPNGAVPRYQVTTSKLFPWTGTGAGFTYVTKLSIGGDAQAPLAFRFPPDMRGKFKDDAKVEIEVKNLMFEGGRMAIDPAADRHEAERLPLLKESIAKSQAELAELERRIATLS